MIRENVSHYNALLPATKVVGNQADPIGKEIAKTDLCTVAGSGDAYTRPQRDMWLPKDYIFTTRTEGTCYYADGQTPRAMRDASGCGEAGSNIGCAIVGQVPYYRRTAYGGNSYNATGIPDVPGLSGLPGAYCCLNQPPNNVCPDGTTCGPEYKSGPQSPGCGEVFKTYCSAGGRVFSDSKCQQWALAYPTPSFEAAKAFCDNDPLNPYCKIWANKTTNPNAFTAHREAVRVKSAVPGALEKDPRWLDMCRATGYRGLCNIGASEFCAKVKSGEIKFMIQDPVALAKAKADYDAAVLAAKRTTRLPGSTAIVSAMPVMAEVPLIEDTAAKENAMKFCACVNSPIGRYGTECVDADCADWGYKTTEDPPDCKITSCDVIYNILETGRDVRILNNEINQQCMSDKEKADAAALAAAQQKELDDAAAKLAATQSAAAAEEESALLDDAEEARKLADEAAAAAKAAADKAAASGTAADKEAAAAAATKAAEAEAAATAAEQLAAAASEKADAASDLADKAAEAAEGSEEGSGSGSSEKTEEFTAPTSSTSNAGVYYAIGGGAVFLMAVAIVSYFIFRRRE